ncbi:MAG: endo-1,4-beta-xylanase [Lachnospiraceae bacterium]|nr:endo-1,4-beta-xylanase [Lachnospiraceae bacterium]
MDNSIKNADLSHRKVTKTLRILDGNGNPMPGMTVSVNQLGHKFLFGCGAFDFIPYVLQGGDDLKTVTDSWLQVFNYGTLPFYWGNFEREEGKPNTEALMKTAKYLKDKGVTVKGHPLCWHTVCADWLLKYDNATIMKKQLERIDREVSNFKGVIDMWDVINEVVIMPAFDKYDNAVTRLCKEHGRVPLVKAVFDRAKANNPEATLLLNDFNTSAAYEELISDCLDAGVPISAIGIQSHQHQGYWGLEKLYDVLERFSKFGLPIHFTENTLISGDIMPAYIEDLNDWQVDSWPSTPEGEERQAREIEEMYRVLFANPLVEAITTWDYKDGAWLGAPSGFLRKDNTKKPSYEMLKKLIHEEWTTNTEAVTDLWGNVTLEAFKGDYKITVNGKETNARFDEDGELVIRV